MATDYTDPDHKFTLPEYEEYCELPSWRLDSCKFTTKEDYHEYWSGVVDDWQQQFNDEYKETVQDWLNAREYCEKRTSLQSETVIPDKVIANSRIPYAKYSMRKKVSTLYCNYPQPTYISPNMQQDKYCSALDTCKNIELKQNQFPSLMFHLGVDVSYANLGVLKTWVDFDQEGPFGKKGKIVISKIDPAKCYFDPKAKRLNWDDLGFIVIEEDMDIGAAREQYSGGAHLIQPKMGKAETGKKDGMFGTRITSPVPNEEKGASSMRNRVTMRECWFKDYRLKFVANEISVSNPEFLPNPDYAPDAPDQIPNPDYDPDCPEVYSDIEVDDDGYVVGKWVPAYPDGRCIVLAETKVVLDFANPNWHGRAPFAFYLGAPSTKLLTTGILTDLAIIDMKRNDLLSRMHRMAQCEIERPMMAETNTFKSPRDWMKIRGGANDIVVVNPGRNFMRMPPNEIAPESAFVLLARYDKDEQEILAMSGVMQGQIAEGAQLSGEAMMGLQGLGTAMLKMEAEFTAEGNKELGFQLMWLQRQTYDYDIPILVALPDGTTETVNWNDDNAASDYVVDIQSGTGLPGADQAQQQAAVPLFKAGVIDQQACLEDLRRSDGAQIIERMKKDTLERIEAQASGKAQGLQIKDAFKPDGVDQRNKS